MNTYSSKNALLGAVIDFAGTFPPANLSLSEALTEASLIRARSANPWLFSKVAANVGDLKTLSPKHLFEITPKGEPWIFTSLCSPISDSCTENDLVEIMTTDLKFLTQWNQISGTFPNRHWVVGYEFRLPEPLWADGLLPLTLTSLFPLVESASRYGIQAFIEIPVKVGFEKTLETLAVTLAGWSRSTHFLFPGIKVRTGGVIVPSSHLLAEAIWACTISGVRFKATQGLHRATTLDAAFGFVNLFAALTFSVCLGEKFGRDMIRKCLEVSLPKDFYFGQDSFSWRGYRMSLAEIERAKSRHQGTFGSCSFSEPDESLSYDYGGNK